MINNMQREPYENYVLGTEIPFTKKSVKIVGREVSCNERHDIAMHNNDNKIIIIIIIKESRGSKRRVKTTHIKIPCIE